MGVESSQQARPNDVFLWAGLLIGLLLISLFAIGPLFNALPKPQTVPSVVIFEGRLGSCSESPPSTCGFSPSTLTLRLSQSLFWTNQGSLEHTVTSINSTAGGGWLFDSGLLSSGAAYAFELSSQPGEYEYFCRIHPWMKGTITVG